MKIHFLSCRPDLVGYEKDASFLYRCENLAVALSKLNIKIQLQHITEFKLDADTSHVIFLRPRLTPRLKRIIKQLKNNNITAIADFDDLVFSENYSTFSPAILNNIMTLKKVIKGYQRHAEALTLFEHMTVSTEALKRYASRQFEPKNIHIIRNYAHYKWPYKRPHSLEKRKHVLTYFPGTRSHDRDFWQIADILPKFLEANPSVGLLVVGPLSSQLLKTKRAQIKHIAKLPFTQYMQIASNSWVNLLPLEPTPFNQCKSAIKVLEAATNLAPTIGSPLPDSQRFIGKGAYIANDEAEWLFHLNRCLNEEQYGKMVNSMQMHNKETLNNHQMAIDFCNAFNIPIQ